MTQAPETVRPEAWVPVETAPWNGTPSQLLAATQKTTDALNDETGPHITGQTYPVTAEGDRGRLARYRGASADGAVVVFVIRGAGVRMVLSGQRQVADEPGTAFGQMITGVAYDGSAR